jgi:hypothetical protein
VFSGTRAHFSPVNANSSIGDAWVTIDMPANDPQWLSGYAWWTAASVPTIYVTAAYGTTQHDSLAQLFFLREDMLGFDVSRLHAPLACDLFFRELDLPHPSLWQAQHVVNFVVLPDGAWHTYTVHLAGAPGYNGTIVQLRFDPAVAGAPGAWVNVSRIAPTPPQ